MPQRSDQEICFGAKNYKNRMTTNMPFPPVLFFYLLMCLLAIIVFLTEWPISLLMVGSLHLSDTIIN